MKPIASLFLVAALTAAVSAASAAGLSPRPLTGELIHAPCFIRAGGSLGDEYKSCIAVFEKNNKPVTFGLLTPEGDVYVLVAQKGENFDAFRVGDQVRVGGMRTIMVGGIKKLK